jgi:hypothetical protein
VVNLEDSEPFHWKIKDGEIGPIYFPGGDKAKVADEDWEWLQILNFSNIRQEVDLALSKLAD